MKYLTVLLLMSVVFQTCLATPPATVVQHDAEPVFENKTLSVWLQQYGSTSISAGDPDRIARNEQAIRAVRAIGTNAIPSLLSMVRAEGSKGGLSKRNNEGVDGFNILGETASNAVPTLLKIIEDTNHPMSQGSAAWALAGIGSGATAAIPSLMRLATNSEPNIRVCAFRVLARIPISCEEIVPIASKALSDTNFIVRYDAMQILGNCGKDATGAIPALIEMSTNAEEKLRRQACFTLGRIKSLPDITIPALIARLSDSGAPARMWAAWSIGNFGTLAKEAAPALEKLRNDKSGRVRLAAEEALKQINGEQPKPTNAAAMPKD